MWELAKVDFFSPPQGNSTTILPGAHGPATFTFVNKESGTSQTGGLCGNILDEVSANLTCQYLGYESGYWDKDGNSGGEYNIR